MFQGSLVSPGDLEAEPWADRGRSMLCTPPPPNTLPSQEPRKQLLGPAKGSEIHTLPAGRAADPLGGRQQSKEEARLGT